MLNKEKFKDEIVEIVCGDTPGFAKVKDVLHSCNKVSCSDCDFVDRTNGYACFKNRKNWANSEYEEHVDWSKVPVDTKILVRDHETQPWLPRHFAGMSKQYNKFNFDESLICAFIHGTTSFTASDDEVVPWHYAKLYKEGEE